MSERGFYAKQRVFNGKSWLDARIQSDSIDPGQNISLGTANVAVQAIAKPCVVGCWVSFPLANTKPVYVGHGSGVTTTTGVEYQPGDRDYFPVANTSQLWFVTGTATQTVQVVAE